MSIESTADCDRDPGAVVLDRGGGAVIKNWWKSWFVTFHKHGNCWRFALNVKKFHTVTIVTFWRFALHIDRKRREVRP